jgi:hypothetical protein
MSLCGNRSPITGECIIGCEGFGSCRRGEEDHIQPRSDLFNPLTGEPYPDRARKVRAAASPAEGDGR